MPADPSAPSAESSKPDSLDASLAAVITEGHPAEIAAAAAPVSDGTGEIRIIEESAELPAYDPHEAVTSPSADVIGPSASTSPEESGAPAPEVAGVRGAESEASTVDLSEDEPPAARPADQADAPAGDIDAGQVTLAASAAEPPRPDDLPVPVASATPAAAVAAAEPADPVAVAHDAAPSASDEPTVGGAALAAEPPAPPPAPDPAAEAAAADAALLDSLVLRPSAAQGAAGGAQPATSMSLQDASDDRTVISDPPPGVLAASAEGIAAAGGLAAPIFGSGVLVERPRRVQLSYVQLGLVVAASALAGGGFGALVRGADHVVQVQAATMTSPPAPAATTANVIPLPPPTPDPAAAKDEAPAGGKDRDDVVADPAANAAAHAKKAGASPRRARKPSKKGWTDPFGP
jgi:hypothetical protein